jgi:hypothetical protein
MLGPNPPSHRAPIPPLPPPHTHTHANRRTDYTLRSFNHGAAGLRGGQASLAHTLPLLGQRRIALVATALFSSPYATVGAEGAAAAAGAVTASVSPVTASVSPVTASASFCCVRGWSVWV